MEKDISVNSNEMGSLQQENDTNQIKNAQQTATTDINHASQGVPKISGPSTVGRTVRLHQVCCKIIRSVQYYLTNFKQREAGDQGGCFAGRGRNSETPVLLQSLRLLLA